MSKPKPASNVVIKKKKPELSPKRGLYDNRFFADANLPKGKTKVSLSKPFKCDACKEPCNVLRSGKGLEGEVCDSCAGL
jgi:hypothetical protein